MEQHVPPSPPPISVELAVPRRERAARQAVKTSRTRMASRCSQGKVLADGELGTVRSAAEASNRR